MAFKETFRMNQQVNDYNILSCWSEDNDIINGTGTYVYIFISRNIPENMPGRIGIRLQWVPGQNNVVGSEYNPDKGHKILGPDTMDNMRDYLKQVFPEKVYDELDAQIMAATMRFGKS